MKDVSGLCTPEHRVDISRGQTYPLSLTCWLMLLPQVHSPHCQPRYSQSIWPARWCQSIPSRSVSAQKHPLEQPFLKKFHFEVLLSTRVACVTGSSSHWLCPCSSPSSSQGPAFKDWASASQSCFKREMTVSSSGWVYYKAGRKSGFESCSASMFHTALYSSLAYPGQEHMAMWWSAVNPTLHTGIALLCKP